MLRVDSFTVISLILEKVFWFLILILLNRIIFFFILLK